jgi:hypothetical protein
VSQEQAGAAIAASDATENLIRLLGAPMSSSRDVQLLRSLSDALRTAVKELGE